MSVFLNILTGGASLFEMSENIAKQIKSRHADISLKNIGYNARLNEIEVENQGEYFAEDVQITICDVDNNECYWNNTDNSLTYTFPQMQAHESQELSIAYWGYQNIDVKIQVKWRDKHKMENSKDFTIRLLGLCD